MCKLECSSKMKSGSVQMVETPLEKGPTHVVQSLVGIYGSTPGEVINFIVKSWIGDNIELLEKMDIKLKVIGGLQVLDKFED